MSDDGFSEGSCTHGSIELDVLDDVGSIESLRKVVGLRRRGEGEREGHSSKCCGQQDEVQEHDVLGLQERKEKARERINE